MAEELALVELLREFDGRSVEPFREADELLPRTPETLVLLVELAGDDEVALQVGATWLLKARLETGAEATSSLSAALVELLAFAKQPDAQLHLLQSLHHLDLGDAPLRDTLRTRLPELLRSRNTFVRAWAYNGLAVLGKHSAADRALALRAFDDVPDDESASVKARIRHARKSLGG